MPFEDLTIEGLRSLTKGQIIAKILGELNQMNSKEICDFIWRVKNNVFEEVKLTTTVKREDGPHGRITRIEKTQDILGGKLSSRRMAWTYYPTGEVDTMEITEFDDQDIMLSQKRIKHFVDGRQPISTG